MSRLLLHQIDYDPKYYPRVQGDADWFTVLKYSNILNADPAYDMAPVTVVKAIGMSQPWMLLDGLHRCRAYCGAGRTEIPATIERLPRTRWMARSVELNICNQHRDLDSGDRAWCIARLREEGMNDGKIAAVLMEPIERIEKIVAERIVPIDTSKGEAIPRGRSNRKIGEKHYAFLKAPFREEGLSAGNAERIARAQIPAVGMNVLHVLDSAIAVLSCGVDVQQNEIMDRLQALGQLVRELLRQQL